eukprot:g6901.t1
MYYEDIKSFRDGEPDAPIIIKGPRSAVVRGSGYMTIVTITHHHVHLEGFSIDGSGIDQEDADKLDPDMYYRHLLHVHGGEGRVETVSFNDHEHRSGVTGFNGTNLNLSHARCTCIMLSNFVTHAELRHNVISDCGVTSTGCAAGRSGDGESDLLGHGLELGTPKTDFLAGFEWAVDETAWNAVIDNSFSDVGGACVVVQQGAHLNLVEGNTCKGSKDVRGAGFALLGDANTLRYNYVSGGSGAGLAIGAANHDSEDHQYGVFNQVYHNQLQTNEQGALLDGILPQPSGKVCRNSVEESAPQSLSKECNSTPKAPGSETSAGERDTDEDSAGRGVRPGCHYVTLPPEHVSRCDQADVADEHGTGGTHWSRSGDNRCLEFTFANDDTVGFPTIGGIEITFNDGAEVATYFEVTADGKEVVKNGVSSGNAEVPAEAEMFIFQAGDVTAEKIRYTAFGSKDANSDSAELELRQGFSETVALCKGAPREGRGAGRSKSGGDGFL